MKKIDRKKIDEMCITPGGTIKQAMEVIGRGEIMKLIGSALP